MRVIVDTNILISAVVLKSPPIRGLIDKILSKHKLIITDSIINETQTVILRKWPNKLDALYEFLSSVGYEHGEIDADNLYFEIRDPKDQHILFSAHALQADVLITGDKDFFDLKAKYDFEILSPADFLRKYPPN